MSNGRMVAGKRHELELREKAMLEFTVTPRGEDCEVEFGVGVEFIKLELEGSILSVEVTR